MNNHNIGFYEEISRTVLWGVRSGQTQIMLYDHRSLLQAQIEEDVGLYDQCIGNNCIDRAVDLRLCYRICKKQVSLFFFFFLFSLMSLSRLFHSDIETSQSIGGRNGSTPGKPPDTPASRTCLVSHVASAGLEPTPDTAVR